MVAEPADDPGDFLPQIVGQQPVGTSLLSEGEGVEELAVDVELELVLCRVPDPHRCRAPVPLPVVQDVFVRDRDRIDTVEDPQGTVRSGTTAG